MVDAIGHAKEDLQVVTTDGEVLRRRLKAVDEERVAVIEKAPEFVFQRGKVAEKQEEVEVTDERVARRREAAAANELTIDGGETDAEALRKRVLELEEEAARLGVRMAQASELLKTEEASLDAALANLPTVEKIRIMSLL
jgi:predicted metallo-beta-lactamase superfamily hydrolase